MTVRQDKSGRHDAATRPAAPRLSSAILPDPSRPVALQKPLVLLAMCIFGEARGESDSAQRAVARVVLNRARHPHTVFGSRGGASFEDNLRRVILRPGQFSCFRPADPNYHKLLRPCEAESAAVWERSLRSAEEALASWNQGDTLTANSDHYFDDSIQPPSWANPAKRTVKLGRLNFYRLYLPAPEPELRSAEFPPSRDGELSEASLPDSNSGAAAAQLRGSKQHPDVSRRQPDGVSHTTAAQAPPAALPSQEPPNHEPTSAAPGSRPSLVTGPGSGPAVAKLLALRGGLSRVGVLFPMSLPRRVPQSAWNTRLPIAQREPRAGRLSNPFPGNRDGGPGNRQAEMQHDFRSRSASLREAYGSAERVARNGCPTGLKACPYGSRPENIFETSYYS
jgi:spore germination cell wall hydrolase CwlJ-like protein